MIHPSFVRQTAAIPAFDHRSVRTAVQRRGTPSLNNG
jgi:hypothetical protein